MIKKMASLTLVSMALFSGAIGNLAPQQDIMGTVYLVNRNYPVSSNYVPTTDKVEVQGSSRLLRSDAARALEEMFAAAKEEAKITFTTTSGYRSYSKQKTIYSNKLKKVKKVEKANEYVAPPGASEHQLALAMDIGAKGVSVGLNSKFGTTKPGIWVAENGHRFGFIIRYQEGWEDITGYKYEPWHVRFVGVEHATKMYEENIPMEYYIDDYVTNEITFYLNWEEGAEKP